MPYDKEGISKHRYEYEFGLLFVFINNSRTSTACRIINASSPKRRKELVSIEGGEFSPVIIFLKLNTNVSKYRNG